MATNLATIVGTSGFEAEVELSTLDGANGFQLNGADAFRVRGTVVGDESGYSVSAAGDVNGDGFDDVIIGAFNAGNAGADPVYALAGVSYVVFGKDGGFDAEIDLAALDGTVGFRMTGGFFYDQTGRSVSGAGDVNGDGFDDVIVGAQDADYDSGASYVVFGHAGGFPANLDLSSLDGTSNGFKISGEARDLSGGSVSAAGDVNGDGIDDVIIGARGSDEAANSAGASYVVFGKRGGFTADLNLSALDGTNGFQISGEARYDQSGNSVSAAGDVNGDGFDDVIVGASSTDANGDFSGAAYVVFGTAGGFGANLSLSALDGTNGFRIPGEAEEDFMGWSVSSAGDVNGDGVDDVVVGAFLAEGLTGASYVVFGTKDGFDPDLDLSALDGTDGFQMRGPAEQTAMGGAVSGAGDVNGDGFDDVIVGGSAANANGLYNSGATWVVFGKAGGFGAELDLTALDGADGFQIVGESERDASGRSVSGAGDVNGDGFDDLIVGAPGDGSNPNFPNGPGKSYVVFGRAPTEAVTRVGSAADQTIRGGDLDDTLYGGGGVDRLFGAGGDDTLVDMRERNQLFGGEGDDIYWIGTALGAVVEYADEGADTVIAQRSLTLSANVENLTLAGDAAVSLTGNGNSLDNALAGHAGADRLAGRAGSDTLDGGAGGDFLFGGTEGDTFIFAGAWGRDVLADWQDTRGGPEAVPDGLDRIDLSGLGGANDVNGLDDLWVRQSGAHVVITLDLDHNGRPDSRDLDGDSAADTARIVVRNASVGNFDDADFIF